LWRPRKQRCRRRRLGGGPWSVSASSSFSLPRTCAADSFISAQLNWPAAVVRACPAAPLRAPSRLSLRPIVASVTCGSSKRDGLAAGCSLAGRYVVSYSVAGCSVAGCSVVMRPKCGGWVRSLRVRLGCFTNLHRQSTGNAVPRIMWTLELQRWPHIWDACGPAP
jgi:hypothetical protein